MAALAPSDAAGTGCTHLVHARHSWDDLVVVTDWAAVVCQLARTSSGVLIDGAVEFTASCVRRSTRTCSIEVVTVTGGWRRSISLATSRRIHVLTVVPSCSAKRLTAAIMSGANLTGTMELFMGRWRWRPWPAAAASAAGSPEKSYPCASLISSPCVVAVETVKPSGGEVDADRPAPCRCSSWTERDGNDVASRHLPRQQPVRRRLRGAVEERVVIPDLVCVQDAQALVLVQMDSLVIDLERVCLIEEFIVERPLWCSSRRT